MSNMTSKSNKPSKRLTPAEYVLRAIPLLRSEDFRRQQARAGTINKRTGTAYPQAVQYSGIHSRNSGFNAAFRAYFPTFDVVDAVNALAEQGVIEVSRARGGAVLYLPGERPEREPDTARAERINAMLTGDDE